MDTLARNKHGRQEQERKQMREEEVREGIGLIDVHTGKKQTWKTGIK